MFVMCGAAELGGGAVTVVEALEMSGHDTTSTGMRFALHVSSIRFCWTAQG